MHIILTLDDHNGMMFNHRRQSRDRVMLAHMLDLVGGAHLWMSGYSAGLFPEGLPANTTVEEDFLHRAAAGEFCFVEDADLAPLETEIETLYVFRWNRVYPFDRALDLRLQNYRRTVVETFPGSSHEKITLERYEK